MEFHTLPARVLIGTPPLTEGTFNHSPGNPTDPAFET